MFINARFAIFPKALFHSNEYPHRKLFTMLSSFASFTTYLLCERKYDIQDRRNETFPLSSERIDAGLEVTAISHGKE